MIFVGTKLRFKPVFQQVQYVYEFDIGFRYATSVSQGDSKNRFYILILKSIFDH